MRIITDPLEMWKVAASVNLGRLIKQAHEEIHHWVDEQSDTNHLVTTRDTYAGGRKGLCVVMTYCANGMMSDHGLLFEFADDVGWPEANAAMIDMAEGIAPMILDRLSGATCECSLWPARVGFDC